LSSRPVGVAAGDAATVGLAVFGTVAVHLEILAHGAGPSAAWGVLGRSNVRESSWPGGTE
jgi:hypothetical protein